MTSSLKEEKEFKGKDQNKQVWIRNSWVPDNVESDEKWMKDCGWAPTQVCSAIINHVSMAF